MPPVLRFGAHRLCTLALSAPLKPRLLPPPFFLRQLHCTPPLGRSAPGRGDPRETTSEMLDRIAKEARKRRDRDYVGPLPLGVGAEARRRTWENWGQLSTPGKIQRSFVQFGNIVIVMLGGCLAIVILIALTTEMFAKNSPSVLYSECIDLIKDNMDELNNLLLPPLKFTHSKHSSAPSRGSTPVHHQLIRNPSSGREHLIISFWIHGRGKDDPPPVGHAAQIVLDGVAVLQRIAQWLGLPVGASQTVVDVPKIEEKQEPEEEKRGEKQGPGFFGRLAKSFSLNSGGMVKSATAKPPPAGTYKLGEARADYVQNAEGTFILLALVVDVPSADAPYPGRATVFWSPEANRESIINRR